MGGVSILVVILNTESEETGVGQKVKHHTQWVTVLIRELESLSFPFTTVLNRIMLVLLACHMSPDNLEQSEKSMSDNNVFPTIKKKTGTYEFS